MKKIIFALLFPCFLFANNWDLITALREGIDNIERIKYNYASIIDYDTDTYLEKLKKDAENYINYLNALETAFNYVEYAGIEYGIVFNYHNGKCDSIKTFEYKQLCLAFKELAKRSFLWDNFFARSTNSFAPKDSIQWHLEVEEKEIKEYSITTIESMLRFFEDSAPILKNYSRSIGRR